MKIKVIFNGIYLVLSVIFVVYLLIPAPKFPDPPPGAVQSIEEADTETPLRRAYFTNYTREQVIDHYLNQFSRKSMILNYPPEDAGGLIRDQTRSYYLQELVHPFRESLFINGFIAQKAQDDIWYKGVHYEAKITIKYNSSSLIFRLVIAGLTLVSGWLLINVWSISVIEFIKVLPRRKK